MPHLGLDEEGIKEVKKKYGSEISLEVHTGMNRWFFGFKQGNILSQKGDANTNYSDRIVGNLFAPQYVVKKMWDKSEDLLHIAELYIMCFLNDYKMGIYDPEVGLSDPNKSTAIMKSAEDGEPTRGGKNWRILKVASLLTLLSQAAIEDVPPRRHRMGNSIEVQAGTDSEGKSFDTEGGEDAADFGDLSDVGDDEDISDTEENFGNEEVIKHVNRKDSRRAAKTPEGMLTSAKGTWMGGVAMPEIVKNIRQIIKQNLGAYGSSIDPVIMRLEYSRTREADLTRKYDEEFAKEKNPDGSQKYKTDKEREKAVDAHVRSILPEVLKSEKKAMYDNMTQNQWDELLTKLKLEKRGFVDFNFDQNNPDYAEDFISAMEEFWDMIMKGGEANLPKYNEEKKKFEKDSRVDFSLQNFLTDDLEPISPARFVQIVTALYRQGAKESNSSKTKDEVKQDLKYMAPKIYKKVLENSKHYKGQKYEEIVQMLLQAGLGGDETNPVQQQPQQKTQQPQQPQQQQPQMAANVIDDLLSSLTKYVGHADFIKLVDHLAARVEELKTSPNRKAIAEKIKSTYEKIREIRDDMFMADKLDPYNQNEITAFNKLGSLYKALAF
jgi:hypothetical protein